MARQLKKLKRLLAAADDDDNDNNNNDDDDDDDDDDGSKDLKDTDKCDGFVAKKLNILLERILLTKVHSGLLVSKQFFQVEYYTVTDLRRGARDTRPPSGGPNSFIFMQFSAKNWKK